MKDNTKYFFVILASVITVFSIPLLIMDIQVTKAYDVYPSTDTARESARTTQSEVYRFGNPVDNPVQYSDGTIVPSRTFSIEAMNHTTGKMNIRTIEVVRVI